MRPTLLCLALVFAGCAETPVAAHVTGQGALFEQLTAAAEEFDVPVELLAAAAWSESRLVHRDSELGRRGLFQLDETTLARAAALIDVSPVVAATDVSQHTRAFAALVAAGGSDHWAALAVTRGDDAGGRAFVDGIALTLAQGFDADTPAGHLQLAPDHLGVLRQAARPDTPLARWVASPNFNNSNRARGQVDTVVIHVTQGSYAGAISWFQNPESQVSSHYVIRSGDGQITQMVEEEDTAWHARNWNGRSIGIEHEGFVDQPAWFTEEMYQASAALTREICERWAIPLDRQHILGHVELTGNDHTDPGPHWDWDHFMNLVRGEDMPVPPCAVVGPGGGTLDDTGPCFQAFGPDQFWRREQGMGEGGSLRWTNAFQAAQPSNWARWRLHLEVAGEYDVAISTGGFGVYAQTPYQVRHAGESTAVEVNQSAPEPWLPLGRFHFAAGGDQFIDVFDHRPGPVPANQRIVADAVRLTPVGVPVVADAGVSPSPDAGTADIPDADQPDPQDAGITEDAEVPEDPEDTQVPETLEDSEIPKDRCDDCADAGNRSAALEGEGGCSTAPKSTSPLWWLGLLVFAARRRR